MTVIVNLCFIVVFAENSKDELLLQNLPEAVVAHYGVSGSIKLQVHSLGGEYGTHSEQFY
jgi:hypothetical protein